MPEDKIHTVLVVLEAIATASKEGKFRGEFPCPKCGKPFKWWRVSGRAAGGACPTPNCLEFRS